MLLGHSWSTFLFKVLVFDCHTQLLSSYLNREVETCQSQMGLVGICIPFSDCEVLRNSIPYNRIFEHKCDSEKHAPKVCCPVLSDNNKTSVHGKLASVLEKERPSISPNKSSLLPEECGWNKPGERKIVGGYVAKPDAWPWMVALFIEINWRYRYTCGASLITNRHIITAAHCLKYSRTGEFHCVRNLLVVLGENDLSDRDPTKYPSITGITSFTVHQYYDNKFAHNDIAILKLYRRIEFTDNISPICLPYGELYNENLTGRKTTVIGWGKVYYGGPNSDVLLEVELDIVTNEECRDAFEKINPIWRFQVCAGVPNMTKDACKGDSGGPLMILGTDLKYYLIGIVAYGRKCANPGYPGVYTRVTEYLDWINENLT